MGTLEGFVAWLQGNILLVGLAAFFFVCMAALLAWTQRRRIVAFLAHKGQPPFPSPPGGHTVGMIETPVKIDTRTRLIELRARRNALFNLKNRMCDYFRVYEPAPIFLEYAQAAWELADDQDTALHDLDVLCKESIEYRNKLIDKERAEAKKKADADEKTRPAIAKLRASGGKR